MFIPIATPYKGIGNDTFTKLLLHMSGVGSSTTFIDSRSTGSPNICTAAGNTQIDTSQSKFGGSSGLFDGNGDYISIPDSADWDLTGDFTIDCWIRLSAIGKEHTMCARVGGGNAEILMRIDGSNRLDCFIRSGTGGGAILGRLQPTDTHTTGVWYHIAYVRSGSNFYLFRNGVQLATTTSATAGGNTAFALSVGGRSDSAPDSVTGWLDEFRLSKGIARWTGAFTPPVAPYGA